MYDIISPFCKFLDSLQNISDDSLIMLIIFSRFSKKRPEYLT